MNRTAHTLGAAALLALAGTAFATVATGPSSSQSPYLTPVPNGPAIDVISILTTGDSVNNNPAGAPYRMAGTPDGLGAFDNGDGTMTLLMNHEFTPVQGIARAHGGTGAFVSQWTIRTTPGANFLQVNHGQDLDTNVVTSSQGPGGGTNSNTFSRFCSADLAPQTAFFNAATGLGTQERIFLNGEEAGANGRVMAHVVSQRTAYELSPFQSVSGSWENALANPAPSNQTLVMANSDGTANRLYAYVGQKQASGSVIERAGLTNGTVSGIQVSVNGVNVAAENRTSGFAASGAPVLSGQFTLTTGDAGTSFLRPEDGAWDTSRPSDYYFVTTDRLDTTDGSTGGPAGQIGRSRLWRMHYANINNPSAGGTIEALLDGTEGQVMFDNITVVPGTDGHTRIIACEDVGNASHNGKVWLYDTATDDLTTILRHDVARFGDVGVPATAPFTQDKESSGVIDARDTLGLGWFLIDVQDHHTIAGELAEGGQLLAFYAPSAIPAPSAAGLLGLAGIAALRRRRA